MKKKIIASLAVVVAVVSAFAVCEYLRPSNVSLEHIPEKNEDIFEVGYEFDMAQNISDMNVVNDLYDYVALVNISSIDKVSNINETTGTPSMVYSKGKAQVLSVLKGNMDNTITFERTGGKMPWTEWIKGVDDPEKLINLAKESGTDHSNTIVDARASGDIELETGKTYLVFMHKSDEGIYHIGAYQYGTRELQNQDPTTITPQGIQSLKVKDNVTGEWVSIKDIVNFDVKQ